MTLSLTEPDLARLRGDHGPAVKLATSILVQMAEIYGAAKLMDITGAHIDSTIYIGEAGLEFAESLPVWEHAWRPHHTERQCLDEHHWQEWAVPAEWARNAYRQMLAYQSMGCIPTWTCAPYQTDWKPKFGQQIAWASRMRLYMPTQSWVPARSVILTYWISAALSPARPAVGLHLTENRR